jgi:predicted N-acetyltransferase YhbS
MGAMRPQIAIRSETGADAAAITEVTIAAFKALEISNKTAQFIRAKACSMRDSRRMANQSVKVPPPYSPKHQSCDMLRQVT